MQTLKRGNKNKKFGYGRLTYYKTTSTKNNKANFNCLLVW